MPAKKVTVDAGPEQVLIVIPTKGAQALGWLLDALMDTAMHVEAADLGLHRGEMASARSTLIKLSVLLQSVEAK